MHHIGLRSSLAAVAVVALLCFSWKTPLGGALQGQHEAEIAGVLSPVGVMPNVPFSLEIRVVSRGGQGEYTVVIYANGSRIYSGSTMLSAGEEKEISVDAVAGNAGVLEVIACLYRGQWLIDERMLLVTVGGREVALRAEAPCQAYVGEVFTIAASVSSLKGELQLRALLKLPEGLQALNRAEYAAVLLPAGSEQFLWHVRAVEAGSYEAAIVLYVGGHEARRVELKLGVYSAAKITSLSIEDGAEVHTGDQFKLSAIVEGQHGSGNVSVLLSLPRGLSAETKAYNISLSSGEQKKVTWVIKAEAPGDHAATVRLLSSGREVDRRRLRIKVLTPAMLLHISAPARVKLGKPFDIAVLVENGPIGAEVTVELELPRGIIVDEPAAKTVTLSEEGAGEARWHARALDVSPSAIGARVLHEGRELASSSVGIEVMEPGVLRVWPLAAASVALVAAALALAAAKRASAASEAAAAEVREAQPGVRAMEASVMSEAAAASDMGLVRTNNEDAAIMATAMGAVMWTEGRAARLPSAELGYELYAVFDGVGGHARGEAASRIAAETLLEYAGRKLAYSVEKPHQKLAEALELANKAIRSYVREHPDASGMATTATACVISPRGELHYAHVGDSKLYVVRASGAVEQVTRDHTLVEDMVSRGLLTPEEAATHPRRHVITRALGIYAEARPDTGKAMLKPGDFILACTDGLSDLVSPEEIAAIVRGCRSVGSAVAELVSLAKARGGADNITVVAAGPFNLRTSSIEEKAPIDFYTGRTRLG